MPGVTPSGQRDVADALERLLAGEVVVRSVLEGEAHVGQPVQRHRSRHLQLRQSAHAVLDGHGDEPLDLFGGVARPLRDDLHHRRRDVRIRVHRQPRERPDADADEDDRQHQDEQRLVQRRANDPMHHRRRRVCLVLLGDVVRVHVSRRRRRAFVVVRNRHWLPANWRKSEPSTTMRSPTRGPPSLHTDRRRAHRW